MFPSFGQAGELWGEIRSLTIQLTEARARLTEAQAQNESRGLALLAEQRQLADARARIAELESEADRIHADRVRLADKCRELESRNAAEKAAAEWLTKYCVLVWSVLEGQNCHARARELREMFRLDEAIPAPDAKGAVK